MHSWITVVTESMGQSGLSDFLKRFPIFGRVFLKLNPKWLNSLMDGAIKHQTYTIDLVKRSSTLIIVYFLDDTNIYLQPNPPEDQSERLHKLPFGRAQRFPDIRYSVGRPCLGLCVRSIDSIAKSYLGVVLKLNYAASQEAKQPQPVYQPSSSISGAISASGKNCNRKSDPRSETIRISMDTRPPH